MTANAGLVRDDDPDRAMTLVEAAALVGVSRRTLRDRVSNNELPTIRVGRTIRIQRRDLLAFIEAHRH